MRSTIAIRQNEPENLRLLAAQRYYYSRAKKTRRWRVFVSVGLAVIAPIALLFLPDAKPILAVSGGVWTLLAKLVLEGIEKKCVGMAAITQEEFDTNVFGLHWNKHLGTCLSPEIIAQAARKHGEDHQLRDWYADTGNVPFPLDVLLCQRSNAVWDWRLRRHYGTAVTSITVGLFVIGIVVAAMRGSSVMDYVLGIFIPSLSAYLHGIEVAKGHFQSATEKEKLEKDICSVWESAVKGKEPVELDDCRRIQDRLFNLRKQGPLVPDRWYNWLRDQYEVDMQEAVSKMKAEAETKAQSQL